MLRLPLLNQSPVENPPDPAIFNIRQMEALPVTSSELQAATRADPLLGKILCYVRIHWPYRTSNSFQPYKKAHQELSVEGDCLLRGTRIVMPVKHRQKLLEELHQGHCGTVRMKALARSYVCMVAKIR